jgi:hypothetical protein
MKNCMHASMTYARRVCNIRDAHLGGHCRRSQSDAGTQGVYLSLVQEHTSHSCKSGLFSHLPEALPGANVTCMRLLF